MAIETKGRWSEESVCILTQISQAKARKAPPLMRFQVALVWERRWTRMFATMCAVSFAASLVEPACHVSWFQTGGEPAIPRPFVCIGCVVTSCSGARLFRTVHDVLCQILLHAKESEQICQ